MTGQDLGKLLLRITVGALLLLHGLAKLRHGIAPIHGMVTAKGLPSVLAYGVYIGEVLAPILVLLGYFTRPAAIVIAINMVVAVALAHSGNVLHLGRSGGSAVELEALYFAAALAIALFGAGRYSVSRGASRWD
ncbi:MAG: DoxX family protein [Polyangia bacterium]|jgi:putative oxidoreductase